MFPRSFLWTFFGITLVDFVMNTLDFFFDHDHWHKGAVVMNVLCLALTSHRLMYPLKPSRDRT